MNCTWFFGLIFIQIVSVNSLLAYEAEKIEVNSKQFLIENDIVYQNWEKVEVESKEVNALLPILGQIQFSGGLYEEAISNLKSDQSYNSDSKKLLIMAKSALSIEKWQEADRYLKRLIKIDPQDNDALVLRSALLIDQKKYGEAQKTIKAINKKWDKKYLYHYYYARLYEARGQGKKSIFHYFKSIDLNPSFYGNWRGLLSNKYVKGSASYDGKIARYAESLSDYKGIGLKVCSYFYDKKDQSRFLQVYTAFNEVNNLSANETLRISAMAYHIGIHETALNLISEINNKSLDLMPLAYIFSKKLYEDGYQSHYQDLLDKVSYKDTSYKDVYSLRLSNIKNNYQLEKPWIEKQEKLWGEKKPEYHYITGNFYKDHKDYTKAIYHFKKSLKLKSTDENIMVNLAETYYLNKKQSKAERAMKRVLKVNPYSHRALNFMAYHLAEKGKQLGKAKEYIQTALRFYPKNIFYLDTLAWIYFKDNNLEESLKVFEGIQQVISLSDREQDPTILEHHAEVLIKLGKNKESQKILEILAESKSISDKDKARVTKKIGNLVRKVSSI